VEFDRDVTKFHEIADSLTRVDYGDPAEVAAGYQTYGPLIAALRSALAGAAAQTGPVPSLGIGGFLTKPGLVFAHKDEVVLPIEKWREILHERMQKGGLLAGISKALLSRVNELGHPLGRGQPEATPEASASVEIEAPEVTPAPAMDPAGGMARVLGSMFGDMFGKDKNPAPLASMRGSLQRQVEKGGLLAGLSSKLLDSMKVGRRAR
jgi:hypothetical protein